MSNNIRNVKSSIGNTIDVATTSIDVSTELVSDVSKVAVAGVRGFVPTLKTFGRITGKLCVGMANSDLSVEDASKVYDNLSINSSLEAIEAASIAAGQALMKD